MIPLALSIVYFYKFAILYFFKKFQALEMKKFFQSLDKVESQQTDCWDVSVAIGRVSVAIGRLSDRVATDTTRCCFILLLVVKTSIDYISIN